MQNFLAVYHKKSLPGAEVRNRNSGARCGTGL